MAPARRDVLAWASGAAAPLLSGCSLGGEEDSAVPDSTPATAVAPSTLPGSVRPDGDPPALPDPLECDDDSFTRMGPVWNDAPVQWGAVAEDGVPTFALRASATTVARGDSLTVSLTNLRAAEQSTAVRDVFNLEVLTTTGYQEVRGWDGATPMPYPSVAVAHAPGEGSSWTLTLAGDAVVEDHVHAAALTVCPGLPAGRYRFVYRGVSGAVGVAFDVTE